MNDQIQEPAAATGTDVQQPGLRFLEITVYIMGGLLVLMLIGLIGGIIWKATQKSDPVPQAPKLFGAGIPPGTRIDTIALEGDRLAIQAGGEVIVIDTKKGQVLSRIQLFQQ